MPSSASSPIGVAWQPWSGVAFARARDEHKPVLLSISATWCRSCHEMDRTSYADAEIAAFINDRFVPIRVDADDRPDISERYSLGGWPTTAFLTATGDILGGGTFVPRERMREVLARVAEAYRSQPERTTPLDEPTADAIGVRLDEEQLTAQVFASFDHECGGFGVEPKFPHTAPLQLALELYLESSDPTFERIVVSSLDGMGWGGLYDSVDGGFFRYATTRDWQLPHFEKLLEVNASLARLFLDAGSRLRQARFTDRASDTLRYIQTWLADPVDGGWYGSQEAADRYYAAESIDGRRAIAPPRVATSLYADSNAIMVSTALAAAKVFGDDGLREFAFKSLERVLLAVYQPGAGVAHYFDGQPHVRGLLADQLTMTSACVDAFEVTGNVVYQMMAEELAHYAVRTMWDEVGGGFFDRTREDIEPPVGLMSRALKPFVTNCEASRTLYRLASASGEGEFARIATAVLDAMHPLASIQGPLAAHYLLAVRAARAR